VLSIHIATRQGQTPSSPLPHRPQPSTTTIPRGYWDIHAWMESSLGEKVTESLLSDFFEARIIHGDCQGREEHLLRTRESFRLEKTFKIIGSNCKPNSAKSTTEPCP